MDIALLREHIDNFVKNQQKDPLNETANINERKERVAFYQSWTKENILRMAEDDFYEYMAKLWAMLIWGNKRYAIDKIVQDNGFDHVKLCLGDLVWGAEKIAARWDIFRKNIKV